MGQVLIMSKYPTRSTCNRSVKDPSHLHGRKQSHWLWAQAHTCITWFLLHSETQKPALWPPVYASWQGKEWEDTHTRRCGSCPRENRAASLPLFQRMGARGWRGWGRGRRRMPSGSVLLLCFSFTVFSSLLLPLTSGYCICYKNLIPSIPTP